MNFYHFKVRTAKDEEVSLEQYKGKVVLIVNVASQCGFTGQYEGLQELYEKYHDKGLEILAFPCNQFGHQEPGSNEEIQNFCTSRFQVTFPVFAKVDVNGKNTSPLYDFLKRAARGFLGTKVIKWNFTKFLVSREGKVLRRFAPQTKPDAMIFEIELALKAQPNK